MPTQLDNPDPLHFRVSPEVLGPLGAEQLQDPALAVLELIKNSWDADAKRVKVEIRTKHPRRIVVDDNGDGMSATDFKERWLVIGASHKRGEKATAQGRPYIGEKGLGRLATFALGRTLRLESAAASGKSFRVEVDWGALQGSPSLEDYPIELSGSLRRKGTRIEVADLIQEWTPKHTDYLVSHADFLTAIPGSSFNLTISVDSVRQSLAQSADQIARMAEATLEMTVNESGIPQVISCQVNGNEYANKITLRPLKPRQIDNRLAGTRLIMHFFRRDEFEKRLGRGGQALERNFIKNVLERYHGIRIYRNGINVPPYGINADDWASLERQRTRTGGPTMVPGNTQLIGELHVSRELQPHLVVTAGRAGFADQQAVASMAEYVRWSVRALATARRADILGISSGAVPGRVDQDTPPDGSNPALPEKPSKIVGAALESVTKSDAVRHDPHLKRLIEDASTKLLTALERSEEMLRLYAQLASTGIAATSFAHELRADFDVITEAIAELVASARKSDRELLQLLTTSWARVKAFAALFRLVPVKIRRKPRLMTPREMAAAAATVSGLATPDKVTTKITKPSAPARVVPAELDSILVNLVSNAVKAINESDNRESGTIAISMESVGKNLEIRVADNGCGVSDKVRRVMFEPVEGSFTEGTGMGLPIVQFLATRYRGSVSLSERPPASFTTEFRVVLRDVVENP